MCLLISWDINSEDEAVPWHFRQELVPIIEVESSLLGSLRRAVLSLFLRKPISFPSPRAVGAGPVLKYPSPRV